MDSTRVFDYMIRSGMLTCNYAGMARSVPISIGISPREQHGELSVRCKLSAAAGGLRVELFLDNDTGLPVQIDSVVLDTTIFLPQKSRFFCNGYQSRSKSGFTGINKGMPRHPVFGSRLLNNSGDYGIIKRTSGSAHSWTYSYFNAPLGYTLLASLDESIAFTRIAFRSEKNRDGSSVHIEKDCDGLIISPVAKVSGLSQTPIKILDVFMTTGDETGCWDRYTGLYYKVNSDIGRYNHSKPAFAWDNVCSSVSDISELKVASVLREYDGVGIKPDYMIFGSNYASAYGDWNLVNNNIKTNMSDIFTRIKLAGIKPGISFAPFVCSEKSLLFRERRELLWLNNAGVPICIGRNSKLGGNLYLLDLYNVESRKYLKRCMRTFISEWGAEFIRAEMLFAAGLNSGYSVGRTRAQAIGYALSLLREYAGKLVLNATDVPLGSCFGLFDYCSVAPSVSHRWTDRTASFFERAFREESSTSGAVITVVCRRHLDSRMFSADPGCFTLRKYNNKLTAPQQIVLFSICNLFGGLFRTSDSIGSYNRKSLDLYNKTIASRPKRIYDRKLQLASLSDGSIVVTGILNGAFFEEKIACKTDFSL